jgi:hypothetical protein
MEPLFEKVLVHVKSKEDESSDEEEPFTGMLKVRGQCVIVCVCVGGGGDASNSSLFQIPDPNKDEGWWWWWGLGMDASNPNSEP